MKANSTYSVVIANEACNFTATKYNTTLTGFTSSEAASNAAREALRDIAGEMGKGEKVFYSETLGAWILSSSSRGIAGSVWLIVAKIEEVTETDNTTPETSDTMNTETMNATKAHVICPLDFDNVHDAYNYAMAHRFDENPLAVAIPTDAHGTDYGRSLAINGVKLFGVWSDALDSTANGYVYTTEAGAVEAMKQVEEDDKEAGIYEPDYYKVLDMTKYFA